MKGKLTEIISVGLSVPEVNVPVVVKELNESFSDADITTDGNIIFMNMKLKNLDYTYYPQTYYEPSEWDCDDWIYEEDLEEQIIKIASDLGIDIDIFELSCEQEENEYE